MSSLNLIVSSREAAIAVHERAATKCRDSFRSTESRSVPADNLNRRSWSAKTPITVWNRKFRCYFVTDTDESSADSFIVSVPPLAESYSQPLGASANATVDSHAGRSEPSAVRIQLNLGGGTVFDLQLELSENEFWLVAQTQGTGALETYEIVTDGFPDSDLP